MLNRFFRSNVNVVLFVTILFFPYNVMAQGVRSGDQVSIQYLLTLANGTRVSFSRPGVPLKIIVGKKVVFPLVEEALIGMRLQEEKSVYLKAEHAYGPVDTKKIQPIALAKLPPNARHVGATIIATNPQGKEQTVIVNKIQGDSATLNFNHPLAGQDLIFKLKVLKIEAVGSR